jgi:hypothetical protein
MTGEKELRKFRWAYLRSDYLFPAVWFATDFPQPRPIYDAENIQ